MSMPADFVAVIRAAAAVTAIVDARIHPNVLPVQIWTSDNRRPSICYFVSDDAPGRTFCGADDLRQTRFTAHCSASSYDVAVALADALIDALEDYRGVSAETEIQQVNLDAAFDNPEPEPGLYTKTVQFGVWHSRSG